MAKFNAVMAELMAWVDKIYAFIATLIGDGVTVVE